MKKNLPVICILIIVALTAVFITLTRQSPYSEYAYASDDLQLYPEGETDMAYGYALYRRITPSQARAKMQAYPEAVILDVRNLHEFNTGHIPGAILLPESAVEAQAPYVLPDKDALILVYCQGGVRSQSATKMLVSMGYTNVYDFGGINSWPYDIE